MVRSDTVDRLSASGWAALAKYGIRTIVDLRNDDERSADGAKRPDGIATLHLPLDGVEDREFWDHWELQAPTLYYRPFLDRFPQRTTGVLSAIARAPEGGVLVHRGIGRDRTGLISMLLLALAGVAAEDIAADHGLSTDRLGPAYLAM